MYALYQHYGYHVGDIGRLFIAGFGSSMLFGTLAGSLADQQCAPSPVLCGARLPLCSPALLVRPVCDSSIQARRKRCMHASSPLSSCQQCWMRARSSSSGRRAAIKSLSLTGGPIVCSGRKMAALAYVGTYILSCITKHWSSYGVLMLGRLCGGIATSLLFSAFESWLVSEHLSVRPPLPSPLHTRTS